VARANLVEKLALRTQEAAQHERNFQQMAELAPCGMPIISFIASITTDLSRHVYLRSGRHDYLGKPAV
jgi:hypothetical protein